MDPVVEAVVDRTPEHEKQISATGYYNAGNGVYLIPSTTGLGIEAQKLIAQRVAAFCRDTDREIDRVIPLDGDYSNGYSNGHHHTDGFALLTSEPGVEREGEGYAAEAQDLIEEKGYYYAGYGVFLVPGTKGMKTDSQAKVAQGLASIRGDYPEIEFSQTIRLDGDYSNGYSNGFHFIDGLLLIAE